MPLVTVQLMEGVLSPAEKRKLLKGITDAVVAVYGGPMRLFMHVVIQEVKDGDWIAAGDVVTSQRVRKISTNVRAAAPTPGAAARKAAQPARARGASRRSPKV